MTELRPIRRALISVYDKSGLEDLVPALVAAGVQVVSTGSTATRVAALGARVTPVERLTGFPECLDGRVKTLHPNVHAGLLADRRLPEHERQIADLGIEPFDLLVSNLYPFSQTVASGAGFDDCVEQIDIGGPAMVRAAAKNHASVAVVTSPSQYPLIVRALADGGTSLAQRRALAALGAVTVVPGAVGAWRKAALAGLGGYPADTLAEDEAYLDKEMLVAIDQKKFFEPKSTVEIEVGSFQGQFTLLDGADLWKPINSHLYPITIKHALRIAFLGLFGLTLLTWQP